MNKPQDGVRISDQEVMARVDEILLEQGRLDPLELLQTSCLLDYQDYEAWRMGRVPDLQGALDATPAEAADLLKRAAVYARGQKLTASSLEHRGWGGENKTLRIGSDPGLVSACALTYAPAEDRHQLDLFHDSRGLLLEEEIRDALAERRGVEVARGKAALLMEHDPGHRGIRGFLRLIQMLDEGDDLPPKNRLPELEAIEPLAQQLLGYRTRDFLVPRWSALAASLAGTGFNPGSPRLHASYAWSKAERWDAASEAVEAESGWQQHAFLLRTHAEASWRQRHLAAARQDWMALCWESPDDFERAVDSPSFPDAGLAALWNRFSDTDLPLDTEDFPAWLLMEDPGATAAVPPGRSPPDDRGDVYSLVHRLMTGDDEIQVRKELAEIHPDLFRQFLSRKS